MRRRLYFLVPNVKEAQEVLKELLVSRVCIHNIHVLAREDINLQDLPEATLLQKHDVIHSLLVGAGIGGIIGVGAGLIAFDHLVGGWLLISAVGGAALGGWFASMMGLMLPNIHLKHFSDAIIAGQLLLLVDVPKERVSEIETQVCKYHPNVHFEGIEPSIPGFP